MISTNANKDYTKKPIYILSNYIIWFFLANLYFLLVNLPMVYLLFSISLNFKDKLPAGFSIIFFLCCIPIGPAFTALFSVMGKLVREKTIHVTKDFFIAYKMNFPQAIFFWSIAIIMIGIISVDLRYIISKNYAFIFSIILYIIIGIIVIMLLYILPIISRFYLKTKDILTLSVYYAFKKFHITILNLVYFIAVGLFTFKVSSIMLFFFSSIICYLIMYSERKILLEIQQDMKYNR